MKRKVITIDAYLATVTDPERPRAIDDLRKKICAVVPNAEECISYNLPAFRLNGAVVAGFCATRKGCSYFPFSGKRLQTLVKVLTACEQTKRLSSCYASPPTTRDTSTCAMRSGLPRRRRRRIAS
jgi:uncharacterized protein YdhG (YjbR/CyaY superfamily)